MPNYLTHFKLDEFRCKCGCGGLKISNRSAKKLDNARAIAGIPFIILSAYRCEEHNNKVSQVEMSAHRTGHAYDIKATNSRDRCKILISLITAGFNRFGLYSNFIHVDDDPSKPKDVMWHGE